MHDIEPHSRPPADASATSLRCAPSAFARLGVLVGTTLLSAVMLAGALLDTAAGSVPRGTAATGASPGWSAPQAVSGCASVGGPAIAFPSDRPGHATGPGALVWSAAGSCRGGEGARVQPIGAGEQLGLPRAPHARNGVALIPVGALAATGAPHGEVLIAGARPGARTATMLVQGRAEGPFSEQQPSFGAAPPGALASAYLGDLAAAFSARPATPAATVLVGVERYYARSLAAPVPIDAGTAPARSLVTAMDFRGETLVAWAARDRVFACRITNRGVRGAVEPLGPAGSQTRIAVLLSDDRRAIVMWSAQRGGQESVYLDYSRPGPRFGAARLIERFAEPAETPSPEGSPRLVRLSSEGVLAAWSGVSAGHWVLRAAPIDQRGLRAVSTLAGPGGRAALVSSLAAGPYGEALILFSEPLSDEPAPRGLAALYAVRALAMAPGVAVLAAPALLAASQPVQYATVAVDPDSAVPVAAWRGRDGSVLYAVGPPPPAA